MPSDGPFRIFITLLLLFVIATTACTPDDSQPGARTYQEVQATAVRRTAVAEVQRIIAGDLEPTPTREPAATPEPTCRGAIWWFEARRHVGETRTIQGPVVGTRPAPESRTLLQIGAAYPDPSGVTVLLPAGDEARLTGKTVCISGRIGAPTALPTMELRDASAIFVVN
jgi:hypothetical protein